MFDIKKRACFGGGVIYRSDVADSLGDAVREYLKSLPKDTRANLSYANLSGADLSGADLSGAYLSGAYLSGANLCRTDLSGAYLSGAYLCRTDLSGAYLSGAYLSGADLSGADLSGAYLSGADLHRATLRGTRVGGGISGCGLRPEMLGLPPADPLLELRVVDSALIDGALEMDSWHTCDTVHCIAGWAIHLAGDRGRELEEKYNPSVAGAILVPDLAHLFYESNENAKTALIERLAEINNGADA